MKSWFQSALVTISSCFYSPPLPPGPPWVNKTGRAFFRGRDSREERLQLVSLSKKNPELLDAGITGWFFFREREKHVGKAPLVGFFDFFKVRKPVEGTGGTLSSVSGFISNWFEHVDLVPAGSLCSGLLYITLRL